MKSSQVEKLTLLLSENALDIEDFANCLGISVSQAENLCNGKKRLTNTLARQIEQTFSKPRYWLELDSKLDLEGPNHDLFG